MGAVGAKVCCTDSSGDFETQQTVSRTNVENASGPILREVPLPNDDTAESPDSRKKYENQGYDFSAGKAVEEPKDVSQTPVPAPGGSMYGSEPASMPAGDLTKEMLEVILTKESADDQLCMAVRHLKAQGRLVVLQIQPGGAVEKANRQNEVAGKTMLAVGDTIVSVNGVQGDDAEMVAECKRALELKLKVLPRTN
mmetsp:Transcript_2322/g.4867  ORF Transcript_2322/g.4867 Transcript_2322/m.4867 type:complete len:196 (-) Transcript_2322:148-735(-)